LSTEGELKEDKVETTVVTIFKGGNEFLSPSTIVDM
jgi:hypothetical protein